jgi:hypothetical protein
MSFTTRSHLDAMTAQVARRDARIASWRVYGCDNQLRLYDEQLVRGLYPSTYTFAYARLERLPAHVHLTEGERQPAVEFEMVVRDGEGCWVATHRAWVLGIDPDGLCYPCALLDAEPSTCPPFAGAPWPQGASAELIAALTARLDAAGL